MSEERQIRTADGLTLFAQVYEAEPPQTGAPVFCLHGLTRNSLDFEVIAPRIASLGRRVIALDIRGRGRSDRDPEPLRYNPLVYAQDALKVLDACEVSEAVWLGTSLGGILTMIASSMAPQRIAGAVLNDVGPQLHGPGLARIMEYVGQVGPFADWADAERAVRATQASAFPDAPEAFWPRMTRRLARQRADGRVEFNYDPAIAEPFRQPGGAAPINMWAMFDGLKEAPLLVVRGALSDILAPDGVAEMRARRPDLELAEVARVGHAPTLEEPAAWDALLNFLARVP